MKRDIDLIRQILLKIEDAAPNETLTEIPIDGYSEPAIKYHLELLEEGGYIKATFAKTEEVGILYYFIEGLTTKGHDWIAATRDSDVWKKTKGVINKAGSYTFEIVKEVAVKFIKDKLGLGD
jgi:DNA-binding transcriptional ArsR family regulator